MKILVSACLLGITCRYDGKSVQVNRIEELLEQHELIPFCPEIYGGLSTPRLPCELNGNCVMRRDGADMTEQYRKGAEQALFLCKKFDCKVALLKNKSPSCGSDKVYDGSFSGTLIDGEGITAKLLRENGIKVYNENQIDEISGRG